MEASLLYPVRSVCVPFYLHGPPCEQGGGKEALLVTDLESYTGRTVELTPERGSALTRVSGQAGGREAGALVTRGGGTLDTGLTTRDRVSDAASSLSALQDRGPEAKF